MSDQRLQIWGKKKKVLTFFEKTLNCSSALQHVFLKQKRTGEALCKRW